MNTRYSKFCFAMSIIIVILSLIIFWGYTEYVPKERKKALEEVRELLIKRSEAIDKIASKLPSLEENGEVELHFANKRLNKVLSMHFFEDIPDTEGYPGMYVPERDLW